MSWASDFVGLPFKPGGRGPEAYDCWGLAVLIYRQIFGIELPDFVYKGTREQWRHIIANESQYKQCKQAEGALALLASGSRPHVGVCVDEHRIIHTSLHSGAIIENNKQVVVRGCYRPR